MWILLLIYFIFLLAYLIFNVYAIIRIWALRMPNDMTSTGVIVYTIVIGMLITISLLIITFLTWNGNFKFSFK